MFGRHGDGVAVEAPARLEMFNITGHGYTGSHYDPVFSAVGPQQNAGVGRGGSAKRSRTSENTWSSVSASKAAPCIAERATSKASESSQPGSFAAMAEDPPPPQPHLQARRKRITSKKHVASSMTASVSSVDPLSGASCPTEQPSTTMLGYFEVECMKPELSPDPRCQLELALAELATLIKQEPTIPADPSCPDLPLAEALREDVAMQLPAKHCAFQGCQYHCNSDRELVRHLQHSHSPALNKVAKLISKHHSDEERMVGVYNEAISTVLRQGAPWATYSIDRRCLYNYVQAVGDNQIESLICFCCARRYPYMAARASIERDNNEVTWITPLSEVGADTFCNMSREDTISTLGFRKYLQRYGHCEKQGPNLNEQLHEFEDWQLKVPFKDGDVDILCCPKDRACSDDACIQSSTCCDKCRLPICRECRDCLCREESKMPAAALANDMMIFYVPRELYTQKVTVMEMICASVCLTSMICFTLEAKYRRENPFDSEVHMARHRMGARGNATSFPLPWQDILAELQRQEDSCTTAPDLPWVGTDLSDFVSVLLKTSEENNPQDMAKFIHQAVVRRHVVVELIANAKARGHRAYRSVDMDSVRDKAAMLPENGVPPEIVRLLPHDSYLDKIQVQKAATPVGGRTALDSVSSRMEQGQPNGVVRSGCASCHAV